MKFSLKHGTEVDVLTPDEARALFGEIAGYSKTRDRIRATETIRMDANGNGVDEVYTVPPGCEFEARRVVLDLDVASQPATGSKPLNVAGAFVEYLRSGTRIEYANPGSPTAIAQIPGVQTWGAEQGPYLRNGEVFEVRATGLGAGAILTVTVEGILLRRARETP